MKMASLELKAAAAVATQPAVTLIVATSTDPPTLPAIFAASSSHLACCCDIKPNWQKSGHRWIGEVVMRKFRSLYARGRITMWAPPGDDEGEMELWRNRHDDGEEEDLEKHEVEEAIRLRRELDARTDPSCKRPPAAAASTQCEPNPLDVCAAAAGG